jgi:glutamyl-Q tRNA(Asp) synthetase
MGRVSADSIAGLNRGSAYVGRFAPSPTGDLHLGSLLAAFGSWLMARSVGGRWLLRIEDIDPPREVAGAAKRQLDSLVAFGLKHDEEVLWQSTRAEAYRAALETLLQRGLAFECRCSRSDLAAAGGLHRQCVASPSGGAPAIRLRVADGRSSRIRFVDRIQGEIHQAVDRDCGDFVLLRADGCWAYQLAVVVDDAAQGITAVVRGADLLDSTPRQILLQRALGLPQPVYAHLPLLLDAEGRKLSKSDGDTALDPTDPLPALRRCWRALGQCERLQRAPALQSAWLQAAIEQFDVTRVPHAARQTERDLRM